MKKINRLFLFNQVTGPLFWEMSEELSKYYPQKSILVTGSIDNSYSNDKVKLIMAPKYHRQNKIIKFFSWISYSFLFFFRFLFDKKE